MIAGLRIARKVLTSPAMRRYVVEEFWPGPAVETDAQWLDHIAKTAGTTFHPTSTCMMGPNDTHVVDTDLRVKGLDGIRVIDASIMPAVVSGNTNATVIMIAEKGAEAILKSGQAARARAA